MVPVSICVVSDNNTVMTRAKVIWQKVTSRDSFLVEGKVVGGQQWYHLKERWWFHVYALHCDRWIRHFLLLPIELVSSLV